MNAQKQTPERQLSPEEMQLIKQYMQGEKTSDNEMVNYFVTKLQVVRAEGDEVGKQLQELKKLIAISTERFTGLNSQYNAYARDLLAWLEKELEEQKAAFTPEERAAMLKRPQIIKPGNDQRSSG